MVEPIDNIALQAHQGSVAAIIQLLNDQLANAGVRTRAMLADGVLQLLCEAATVEQLDQTTLVEHIRQSLEAIAPRRIRHVKINSRIVREQQLLWLEEISREPHNLLWSQEITLKKPNLLKRLLNPPKIHSESASKYAQPKPLSLRQMREKQQFQRGILGGAGLSVAIALGGWWVYSHWGQTSTSLPAPTGNPVANPSPNSQPVASPVASVAPASPIAAASPTIDPFAEAVRIAEQASFAGQKAQSSAEWLDLAAKWQKASDLMGQVSPQDPRYATAQDRTARYRNNSTSALQSAQRQQTATP